MDVHPKERKPTIIGQLPSEREQLERIIGHGLVDVGRALDPDNDQMFTWWAPWRNMRQRNIGWRLDYVLASEALYRAGQELRRPADFGTSDHAPVVAEFAVPVSVRADSDAVDQQEEPIARHHDVSRRSSKADLLLFRRVDRTAERKAQRVGRGRRTVRGWGEPPLLRGLDRGLVERLLERRQQSRALVQLPARR